MSDDPPVPRFALDEEYGLDLMMRRWPTRAHQVPAVPQDEMLPLIAVGVAVTSAVATVTVGPPTYSSELLIASQLVVYGDKTKEGRLIEAVAVPFLAIFKELQRDPDFLLKFDPRKLEELIAAAYHAQGCKVTLTPRSVGAG